MQEMNSLALLNQQPPLWVTTGIQSIRTRQTLAVSVAGLESPFIQPLWCHQAGECSFLACSQLVQVSGSLHVGLSARKSFAFGILSCAALCEWCFRILWACFHAIHVTVLLLFSCCFVSPANWPHELCHCYVAEHSIAADKKTPSSCETIPFYTRSRLSNFRKLQLCFVATWKLLPNIFLNLDLVQPCGTTASWLLQSSKDQSPTYLHLQHVDRLSCGLYFLPLSVEMMALQLHFGTVCAGPGLAIHQV